MARTRKSASALFDAITLEGNLITPAMLARIAAHEAGAQSEADYNVPKGLTLRDEIARYFRIGQALFKELFASAAPSTAATSNFVEALLRDVFGFFDLRRVGMRTLGDRSFPVTMEALSGRVPVGVVPPVDDLDRASNHLHTEGRRRSAASSVQDWLNSCQGALWGFCCNGERLRLVRDNASLTRPAYVEANLRQLFEAEDFADFAALWLLIHVTRFGAAGSPIADCTLERWREAGSKEGESARDRLRDGVEAALLALGNGFLSHPDNADLRERIVNNQLPLQDFFGQLLRLVYRMIFLLAAEDRGLLHPPGVAASVRKLYAEGYSLGALRDSAVRRSAWDRFHDRWEGLLITFTALAQGEPQLGLPALGGIFDSGVISDLEKVRISNRSLMEAIYRLAWLKDSATLMPVNWRDMETEELGSVYEGLLELTPRLMDHGRSFAFAEGTETKGNERKTTGSYYTPDSLVQALLDSALDPVLDRVESEAEDAASALLGVTVIDPACGSGHFLLAAARRIATHVAHARAEGVASAEDYRHALRDVARSCIHGVDRNPMAVELTKVALWIETVEPGKPLGFFDANIRCGDSLLGVYDLEVLREGIPDAAYKPLSGDDKVIARDFEKRNKAQRTGQGTLFGAGHGLPALPPLAGATRKLRALPEDDRQQIAEKRRRFAESEREAQRWNWRQAANAYIAAFLVPKTKKEAPSIGTATIPTTEDVFHLIAGDSVIYGQRIGRIQQLADEALPFHWPLEFPDIMEKGGFDVVLGNPPWGRIKLQEQKFFASREPEIAAASDAAVRGRMILALAKAEEGSREHKLYEEFETTKRIAEASSLFVRLSEEDRGRFPLTGCGDVNTYALFAELFAMLTSKNGRAGVILPTGIATDATTSAFFGAVVSERRLVSLYDFQTGLGFFDRIGHARFKFCLMTLCHSGAGPAAVEFSSFARTALEFADLTRRFTLTPAQIEQINPNTRTAPIFRTKMDAELTARIYSRVPVLIRHSEETTQNPWNISLKRMLDKTNDTKDGNLFELSKASTNATKDISMLMPVVEGDYGHQFDHRFGTFNGNGVIETTPQQHEDPLFEPRYELCTTREFREKALHRWGASGTGVSFLGFRRVARSTDVRTSVAAILPYLAFTSGWILVVDPTPTEQALLVANFNSLVFDYCLRNSLTQPSIPQGTFEQVATLPPNAYTDAATQWIISRVVELTYTSHSLSGFASNLGYDRAPFVWDDERRAVLRAELDAWYARAYGLTRDELRYILDPADVKGEDYPSETFRVLKNNELKRYGKYRTQELVLNAWKRFEKGDLIDRPLAKPAPYIPVNPDVLPDNAWATASDLPAYTVSQLAAVVHRLQRPTPIARVRVAALFALEPQLLTRHLSGKACATWLRLVGSAARGPQVGNVLSFASKIDLSWGRAVTQLRGMGELAEDLNAGTWAAGTPVSQYAIDGWAVGRAEFVLGALAGISIDELTADLSPEDRAWVNAAYVA